MASILSPERVATLRLADLTTASPTEPGYRTFERSRTLGRRDFAGAVDDLLTWRVHERAGLSVASSSPRVEEGSVVEMRLGPGPFGLRAPCRVLEVVRGDGVAAFTYGTLPGHPEAGEERFEVRREDDGSITFTISGFSRPASSLAMAVGPLGSWAQDRMTSRYLHVLDPR